MSMKLDTLEKPKGSYSEGEKHLIQTSKEAAMRRMKTKTKDKGCGSRPTFQVRDRT